MHIVAIIFALLAALSIPVIVFPEPGVGWASSEEYLAAFLGWPILLLSVVLCFVAVLKLRSGHKTGSYLIVLLLAASFPTTLLGKIAVTKAGTALYWDRKNRWLAIGDYVNPLLLQYFLQHPDRVRRKPHGTEEAELDGFIDFLTSQPSFRDSGVRVRSGRILDPWGRPVSLLVDYGGDNQLYGRTESIWIGTSSPVEAAVGLMLSEESARSIRGPEYINGRNGYKLKAP
jgi:hypothetical protein